MSLQAVVISEKQVLTDILKQYKELPCLWNPQHEHYNNKAVRKQYYEELLKKFKLCAPNAYIKDLKKKIENMRTAYRREHGKVLKARFLGNEYYKPSLWYYDLLTFLTDNNESKLSGYLEDEEEDGDDDDTYFKTESLPGSPIAKKKMPDIVYIDEESSRIDEPYTIPHDKSSQNRQKSSSESFGSTIGLQLNELRPMQRYIAEKLISEVIFYGRLDKLQPETQLKNLNNDILCNTGMSE